MQIKLTNLTNNLSVTFLEKNDISNFFGYEKTLLKNYDKFVNDTNIFLADSLTGFFGNPDVIPYTERGIKQNGNDFKTEYIDARVISWNFKNVFVNLGGLYQMSPNNYLNTLVLTLDDTILVEVTTDITYVANFHFTEETDTETGVIVMESSDAESVFWKTGIFYDKFEVFAPRKTNSYIIKNLPKFLIEENTENIYPFNFEIVSSSFVPATIKIGSNLGNNWESVSITNLLNGDNFVYNNTVEYDKNITVDAANLDVFNENNQDRTSNITGTPYINMGVGLNVLEITINGNSDYLSATENLPLDFFVEVSFTNLVGGIEIGGNLSC